MALTFDLMEFVSGLTGFVLDESVLKRIIFDRGLDYVTMYSQLTEQDKDLLTADILYAVYLSPKNLPSFQHQHGQFSTSLGQQNIGDRDSILQIARSLYAKWGDAKSDILPTSSLTWMQ